MIPLFVNNPEPMVKVRVIIPRDYSEPALKTLHKIGVLHVEESKELKPVDKAAIELEHKEVGELLTFIDDVLSYLPQGTRVTLGKDIEVIYTKPFNEIGNEVKLLHDRTNKLHERIVKRNNEVQQLSELKSYIEPLANQTNLSLRDLSFSGSYLFSKVFILPNETYDAAYARLKNYLLQDVAANIGSENILFVIAKVKDQKTIESVIADANGRILQMPAEDLTLKRFIEVNEGKIRGLEEEVAKLNEEIRSQVGADSERIALLRAALAAENERLTVLEKASEAKYVTLIEGWIPEGSAETAISEVRQDIGYAFIDTRKPEPSEEPPTELKNSRAVKPFQIIIELFGTPKYREWDPTPIIAYSFALFFGIMTQDVIYSIGIMLLTKFFLPKFADDPNSEGFKLFQRVLYTGAGVGLIVGLLTGSYLADIFQQLFGVKSLALSKALEQIYSSPITLIVVAIGIGFIHINIAHMVALAAALKSKNKGVIVAKIGFFAFQIFLILFVVAAVLKPNLPILGAGMTQSYLYGVYASLVVLAVGIVMQQGYFGAFFWIFELTGFLGDALSYSRLAGIAMAGFYLGSAINMMAIIMRELIPGPVGLVLGTIIAFGVLIVGHLINTVLSILGGFIHSMRLCLVEFMLKFYEGGGRKYSPFSLKTGESLIIKSKA
ncbi:MAG: V-type ATPase 116kDa subunit family protein [Dehalococcoidales bacterium]|nr:V-type ATPase 116kDa subunit family protein [Dehalococcoidales bacterium]